MSPGLSTYLHMLRFFAALVVFAHHAGYERFDGQWIGFLAGYGHEAVLVFFVLSGFVITYATDTREHTPSVYFINDLPARVLTKDVVLVSTMAFVLAVTSTLYPAFRGARTQPAEALRHD